MNSVDVSFLMITYVLLCCKDWRGMKSCSCGGRYFLSSDQSRPCCTGWKNKCYLIFQNGIK